MKGSNKNWGNLRRNKCPICRADLTENNVTKNLTCSNGVCDFRITRLKFLEITSSMNKEAIERPSYRGSEGVEDLHKSPLCVFCGSHHREDQTCDGFGY